MNDTAGSAGLAPAPSAAPDAAAAPAARKAKLRPLRLLVPYVMRYRGRAAAALVSPPRSPRWWCRSQCAA